MKRVIALVVLVAACEGSSMTVKNDLSVAPENDLSVAEADFATASDAAPASDGLSPDAAVSPKPLFVYDSPRALDGTDSLQTNSPFNFWVLKSDGSNVPITRLVAMSVINYGGVWSPDGSKIAFYSSRKLDGSDAQNVNNTSNIWVMNADGSGPTPLTQLTAHLANNSGPVWSPDGSKIAFTSARKLDGSDAAEAAANIWIMNANGSSPTPVTQLASNGPYCNSPIWSPDGNWIAYTSNRKLDGSDAAGANGNRNVWLIHPNGTSNQPVTQFAAASTYAENHSWSFDSTRLSYDSNGALNGSDTTVPTLNVWATAVSPSPSPFPLTQSSSANVTHNNPLWSPVANKIAFLSTAALNGGGGANAVADIWIMNGDGSALAPLTRLTVPTIQDALWSRDGARIAFLSDGKLDGSDATVPNSAINLWSMNADGSMQAPLTNLTSIDNEVDLPNWHP